MTVKDFERLYAYGSWANARLLTAISKLSQQDFTKALGAGHTSIRDTLVHAVSAEWGWIGRSGGQARGPALNPADFPTVDSLVATWNAVDGYARAFLSSLKEEDLLRMSEYKNPKGEARSMPIGEMLHHGANHSVHHRGQAALMIRLLGHAPGDLDMLLYDAERRGVSAW
jgi:uncharacterized damage-inducible protein DinB